MTDTAQSVSSTSAASTQLLGGAPVETYPLIGLVCLCGIFLHLIVSPPVMYFFGIHYGDEDAGFLVKQHIGTYVVALSFILLLFRDLNPIATLSRLYRTETIFTVFLLLYVLILAYMIGRDGPKGLSFLIDTQICAIVAALVLARTPTSYCRRAVYLFIALALLNSLIGIAEGILRERLFVFDPTSGIVREKNFRSSAWLGQPLENAVFTSIMLFIALSIELSPVKKFITCVILFVSLVPFGGRMALIFACLGLIALGLKAAVFPRPGNRPSILRTLMVMAALLLIPVACGFGLYGLINSSMGERLLTMSSFQDESAESRALAWRVFEFMRPEEIVFGVESPRVTELTKRMGQSMNIVDIENPWIHMFLHLGLVAFPVWFAATLALIWRLTYRAPLTLKLAVAGYFIISSGANSFGVKGSMYLLIVTAVICASRSLRAEESRAP